MERCGGSVDKNCLNDNLRWFDIDFQEPQFCKYQVEHTRWPLSRIESWVETLFTAH